MSPIEPSEIIIKELISLYDKKKFDELLRLSNEILGEFPNSILIQNIQGVVYTELKNYRLAKDLFIKVIKLSPRYTDAYYNLANICSKLHEENNAIENYNKVLELDKNYFKAHNNLGNIYRKKGLNKKAIECYLSTLEINPNYKVAYYNLAGVLQFYIINEENKNINKYLLYLLKEKIIVRPNSIAPNVLNNLYLSTDLKKNLSLIKDKITDKNVNYILENLQKNSLLMQFMKVCPIPDYYIEKNFVKIREKVLNQIYKSNFEKANIDFLISLSMQCFLNEYIYDQSKVEIEKIKKIDERIKNNLRENKKINDLDILCLSCYEPLTNFSWSDKIKFSDKLKKIFELHLNQNKIEKQISKSIKSISNVEDRVSIRVKKQYEENPYPRWQNLGLSVKPRDIKAVISDSDLNLDLKKISNSESPEILIAGCGTGQHAITTASKYKKSKILALDLSFKSLSYAKRKANELEIDNIDFIQGDILDLESIDRKFDVIESVGVLHHMDNPFKGWEILTSCLNNDSLMLIGLYSEKARQHIIQIKKKINKLKLQSNYKNIIKFRKDLIENNNDQWNYIKSSPDFYTVSGVRDLLFHVQEHRFTISKIKEYLDKLGLIFLGFEDQLVKENFKDNYINKDDLYNLKKWEEYEKSNPRIFAGMYQFWCKKI
ncbi:methyltransferase domain-containing protein [Pelagibacteraceae bacterium]|nr:methyltransferase domain-containing protein [Pelagibacteraceae bacterium]